MREIWIVNHYAQPPSLPGGTRHHELAKRLAARGFNVTIVASAFHHPTKSDVARTSSDSGHDVIEGVRFIWVPTRFRYEGNSIVRMLNMVEFAARVWRNGRRQFNSQAPCPNIIIGSSPHLLAAVAAARLGRRFGARFILEIRDLWPESLIALGGYSRWHPLIRILRVVEQWLYRRADHIISLLPDAWKYLETQNVSPDHVTWISNGASIPAETDKRTASRDALHVVYVGAHGRANVLEDLLAAAGILQQEDTDFRISLIGDGPMKAELIAQAREAGLGNVAFLDPVPKNDIQDVLAQADVAIALTENTSLYEYGISLNKLFDYFAAGRPILFAGNVAHDYVALAHAGVTVAPRCPACIADGLIALSETSQTERDAMGERGRAYLREHHTWDVLASRLEDVLMRNETSPGAAS